MKPYTSYEELKRRRVIAQGWPLLGDLRELVPLAGDETQYPRFERAIIAANRRIDPADWERLTELGEVLEDQETRAPKVLWSFLQIQPGDLVVALDGIRVRGVCCAAGGYWYDGNHRFAQCIGRDIDCVDWSPTLLGPPPPHICLDGCWRAARGQGP